jgi:hypothetical protein
VDEVTSKAIEIALIDLERVENSTTGETRKRVVWVIDGLRALFRQPTQPVVDVNQQLVDALRVCEECLMFIHGGEPLRTDVPLKLAREALLSAGKLSPQPVVPEGWVQLKLKDALMLQINVNEQLRITRGGCDANRLASSSNALTAAIMEAQALLSAGKGGEE